MSEGNGKFIRGLFWTLLIGSFAWATAVGAANYLVSTGYSKDSNAAICAEVATRCSEDKSICEKADQNYKEQRIRDEQILAALTELKTLVKK